MWPRWASLCLHQATFPALPLWSALWDFASSFSNFSSAGVRGQKQAEHPTFREKLKFIQEQHSNPPPVLHHQEQQPSGGSVPLTAQNEPSNSTGGGHLEYRLLSRTTLMLYLYFKWHFVCGPVEHHCPHLRWFRPSWSSVNPALPKASAFLKDYFAYFQVHIYILGLY